MIFCGDEDFARVLSIAMTARNLLLLLGIYFWREALETAVGLDRREGVAGEKGSLGRAEMLVI